MNNVAAIVCAYNEEKTVGQVLRALAESGVLDEIIVVDDGSTDGTWEAIQDCKRELTIRAIRLDENKGKGNAMAVGIENADSEILLFWDADLEGTRKEHLLQLITPIMTNYADMILGQPDGTAIPFELNIFKSLTGQRALRKNSIMPLLNDMRSSRYGVETLINLSFQSQARRVQLVRLEQLRHPTKFEKTGQKQAMSEFIREGHHITFTYISKPSLVFKAASKQFMNLLPFQKS